MERPIGTLARAALAGAAGAIATNVLHEIVRRQTDEGPRVDLLGMQALAKSLNALGADAPTGRRLYVLTLLGDLVSNAIYFALVATQPPARAVETGTLLGVVAGAGAVLLPPRLGLSAVTTNRTAATQALTVALYTAGGIVAGSIYRDDGSGER